MFDQPVFALSRPLLAHPVLARPALSHLAITAQRLPTWAVSAGFVVLLVLAAVAVVGVALLVRARGR